MAVPNEVRVNIRHNVLILKTFTVPQLQAVTSLSRHSIHTEIRRLEQEELVSRIGIQERQKGTSGGRPPVVYQLTSDPEKRFEVLQFVRRFYFEAEGPPSEPPRPESKHYFIAKEVLAEALREETTLTQDEKAEHLELIKKRLEYARREEEVGEEGTELIAASFNILEAKAMDALADDWERAVVMLDEARRDCQQLGADDLVTEIQAYVRTIAASMAEEQVEFDNRRVYEEVEGIAHNLSIIKHRFGDLPALSAFVKQAEQLAKKARQQQISAVAEEKVAQRDQTIMELNKTLRTLIDKVPAAIEEPGAVKDFALQLLQSRSLSEAVRSTYVAPEPPGKIH